MGRQGGAVHQDRLRVGEKVARSVKDREPCHAHVGTTGSELTFLAADYHGTGSLAIDEVVAWQHRWACSMLRPVSATLWATRSWAPDRPVRNGVDQFSPVPAASLTSSNSPPRMGRLVQQPASPHRDRGYPAPRVRDQPLRSMPAPNRRLAPTHWASVDSGALRRAACTGRLNYRQARGR